MKNPTATWQRFQLAHHLEANRARLDKWISQKSKTWWMDYSFSPFELIATQTIQGGAMEFVCDTIPPSDLARPNEEGLTPIQVGLQKLSRQKERRDFERQLAFVYHLLLLAPTPHPSDIKYLCKVVYRNIKNEETIGQMGSSSQSYEKMYARLLNWGNASLETQDIPLLYKALKQYWVTPFQFRQTVFKGFSHKPLLKPVLDGIWLMEKFHEVLRQRQGSTPETWPTWLKELPSFMGRGLEKMSFYEDDDIKDKLRSEASLTQVLFDRWNLAQIIPEKDASVPSPAPIKKRL